MRHLAAVLAVLAVGLGGCGGDGEADHGEPVTTPTHAPGHTETAP